MRYFLRLHDLSHGNVLTLNITCTKRESAMKSMYKVYDSLGNLMRKFSTYQAAITYKMVYGNLNWTIK